MNKMKNFKRRFSLSVPRTETIEENEFTEQINQLNIRHTQGKNPFPPQITSIVWDYYNYLFNFEISQIMKTIAVANILTANNSSKLTTMVDLS